MATKKTEEKPPTGPEGDGFIEVAPRTPAVEMEPGDVVIGAFREMRTIDVEDESAENGIRPTRFYEMADPENPAELFGIWGSGLLNYKWDNADPTIIEGTIIKVVYKGKEDIGGGRDARQYDLFQKPQSF